MFVLIAAVMPLLAAPVEIYFDPGAQTVLLGQQATAELWIGRLTNEYVGAFNLRFRFDDAILSIASVSYNDFELGDPAVPDSWTDTRYPAANLVDLVQTSFLLPDDLVNRQQEATFFRLASVTFNTHLTGISPLVWQGLAGGYLSDKDGRMIPVATFTNGSIEVIAADVPEPRYYAIVGAALAVILWVRWKWRQDPGAMLCWSRHAPGAATSGGGNRRQAQRRQVHPL
jgi:hypothetical protein